MHIYRKALRGASFLSASEGLNQICSFARNIILARFLAKADFGVAALLGMILTLFEMTGKMALGQQVVQSKHGDNPAFVDGVQFTQLALGTISAGLILIFAWPAAHFFSGPRYLTSIMALALIPFVNGLSNLDLYRRARRLGFERLVLSDTVPQIATTLAAWPLAIYFRDYRAVLWILLGKAVLSSTMTHLLSERRFSPRFDGHWFRESLTFGWPLLLAGFIQFGNFQGDSMVVAAGYTLTQLGEFSVALTMAMTPGLAFLRICHSLSLPVLAEVQADLFLLTYRFGRYVELMALLSCVATLGMIFCGEYMVVLLFGAKYAGVGTLASWLMGAQALRIVRGATVGAAMARGDTMNNMVSSGWRLSGLALAVGVGLLHASLTWFAATGLVGEMVALEVSTARLASKHMIPQKITFAPTLLGLGCVLVAVGLKCALPITPYSPVNWLLLALTFLMSAGAFTACFPELRSIVLGFVGKLNAPLDRPTSRGSWSVQEASPGGSDIK